MTIEMKTRDDRIAEEIDHVLQQAKEKASDCDSILIVMQRKESGVQWFGNDSCRVETMCFLASSFLHRMYQVMSK